MYLPPNLGLGERLRSLLSAILSSLTRLSGPRDGITPCQEINKEINKELYGLSNIIFVSLPKVRQREKERPGWRCWNSPRRYWRRKVKSCFTLSPPCRYLRTSSPHVEMVFSFSNTSPPKKKGGGKVVRRWSFLLAHC